MRPITICLTALFCLSGTVSSAQVSPEAAKRLCGDRPTCSVVANTAADERSKRRKISVVELAIRKTAAGVGARCRPYIREFWIVAGSGAGATTKRLMTLCNDGYGAAGVGEDEVSVTPNRIIYTKRGGSNWRWIVTRQIQLVPAQILAERHCSFWTAAPGFSIDQWSWRKFSGLTILRYQPAKATDKDVLGCEAGQATHQYLNIPSLTGATGIPASGAVTVGTCGIVLREDGRSGFTIYGDPSGDNGAVSRLLLVGNRELLVTTEMPAMTGGENWIHSDHLEIWQAGIMSISRDNLTSEPLVQFGVQLSNGKVFAGYGKPKALPTVIARRQSTLANGRIRVDLRLRLPRDANAISVILSRAVKGQQARMVATSPVKFGEVESLGGIFTVSNNAARCAIRNGRLDIVASGMFKALDE